MARNAMSCVVLQLLTCHVHVSHLPSRRADVGYTSRLLSMIAGVSLGDVHDVLSKHVLSLFDPDASTHVIACNPSSLATINTDLAKGREREKEMGERDRDGEGS